MFEALKSALGLSARSGKATHAGDVDPVAERMLEDLGLPAPGPEDDNAPVVDRRDPLEEAREVVTDWMNEGNDIERPLRIVFEALFESEAQAQAYLREVRRLGIDGADGASTRPFVDSIAADLVVAMIPAPEEIARIEGMLTPLAGQAGGQVDGYYLEGHADG